MPVPNQINQQPMSLKRLARAFAAAGRKAGIIVDAETRKHATTHDLRPSFAVMMDGRCTTAELQRLMRHSSTTTTVSYYRSVDAERLAAKLWQKKDGEPT